MMERARLGIVPLAITLQACAVPATQSSIDVTAAGSTRAPDTVRSWRDFRDESVVLQRFDFSCGSAALATLMRYYFGDPVSEEAILVGILGSMSAAEVRDRETNGLSLLDLRNYAERAGYQAVGVRLTLASLPRLAGPVIVHLEGSGYPHFAVLKGVRGDRIYIADPSRGNVRLSAARFANEWSGVALVLGKDGLALPQTSPLTVDDQEPVPNETLAARRALFVR
jgi:predicted double-glycine peptidase